MSRGPNGSRAKMKIGSKCVPTRYDLSTYDRSDNHLFYFSKVIFICRMFCSCLPGVFLNSCLHQHFLALLYADDIANLLKDPKLGLQGYEEMEEAWTQFMSQVEQDKGVIPDHVTPPEQGSTLPGGLNTIYDS